MTNKKIQKAIEFATEKHKGQKRKVTGEDYITHPLKVRELLKMVTDDEDVLVASVLHDVIEDTDTDYDEVKEKFGEKVANLVIEVSKGFNEKYKYNVRTKEGLMIKLADMLHNASDEDPSLEKKIEMIKMYPQG